MTGLAANLLSSDKVQQFFKKYIKHSKGQWAAKPFDLLPWELNDVIRPLFDTTNSQGLRQYRRVWLELGKKNGKSSLCAALAILFLVADEPGAEVYVVGTSRENASLIFNEVVAMVRQSSLQKLLRIVPSTKRVLFPDQNSVLKVLSHQAETLEGVNASCLIADEVHAWKSEKVWNALRYATAGRRQGVQISITTAGERESLAFREHLHAKNVKAGVEHDEQLLPVIYSAEGIEAWDTEEAFALANPSYGHTLYPDEVRQSIALAKASAAEELIYKRYRLNHWLENTTTYIPLDKWDLCQQPMPNLEGQECIASLDMSSKTDLTALVLLFPESMYVLPYFWVPEEACKLRERLNKTRLDSWIAQGHITQIPGPAIQDDFVIKKLLDLSQQYTIRECAFDPWNAIQLSLKLSQEGMTMVPYRQNFMSLNEPTKTLEKLALTQGIHQDGNPVLRWMLGNVRLITDASGNVRPCKKSSREKIDGVSALLGAIGRHLLIEDGSGNAGLSVL